MSVSIEKFFLQYAQFSKPELEILLAKLKCKSLKKSNFLLRNGDVCRDLIIVERGCLRLYYLKDDIDTSVWFAFPGSSAIEIDSFISGSATNYFLQAIEDTEVWVLPKHELEGLYDKVPTLETLMRKFWEDAILTIIQRFTALQTDSAEKRYRDLLNKPDYMASIPQKYLASFIGVTPTSLSRIRKRIQRL
jgi:CRP/FNR family transcriptional regulator, anaerobic regulatory protein